jgi:hypothetical protein
MYTHLCVEYADPANQSDSITLKYKLRHNSVVPKWTAKLIQAQEKYPIDDPARFYGFGDQLTQIEYALARINQCIEIINSHREIIYRRMSNINDYDTLNYLHNIFEVYHGLLDQQTHEFYLSASDEVRKALADLNIAVHRCESAARVNEARHVVTYFGLPKTDQLDLSDYNCFTDQYTAGTVYLNYVEIGKTIENLATDNDHYISDDAFKPFRYYSADFLILFTDSDIARITYKRELIKKYYDDNMEFFTARGLTVDHPYLRLGKIPLADIDSSSIDVLQSLQTRQYVKSVKLI